jgi:hypothetical protein
MFVLFGIATLHSIISGSRPSVNIFEELPFTQSSFGFFWGCSGGCDRSYHCRATACISSTLAILPLGNVQYIGMFIGAGSAGGTGNGRWLPNKSGQPFSSNQLAAFQSA